MNETKYKILVLGLGNVENELIRTLCQQWQLVAVDSDLALLNRLRLEHPAVEYIHGDVGSRVTWKKINFDGLKFIISGVNDIEVNREVCHLAREIFNLQIDIIVLDYRDAQRSLIEESNAILINPLEPGIKVIMKYIDRNVSHAVNIGLGKGELIEVNIKAKSHLVDRKLKYLRPSRWHISAIYRKEKLIMPDGNSKLKVGDRVVLVGDPKVLENVIAILLKGLPQFPLQYGSNIVFPLHEAFVSSMDEATYLLDTFRAKAVKFFPFRKHLNTDFSEKIKREVGSFEIGDSIELFREIFLQSDDTGVLVVPVEKGLMKKNRVKRSFKRSMKPFLLSRLSYPYEGVVISLNGPDPVQALETGIEMAHLADIPIKVVYVTLPREMRGREEEEKRQYRQHVVSDFEGIYKDHIDYTVLEGNPVRETLKFLEPMQKHVLVLVSNPKAPISFFNPNVSYLLARNTHLSTLVIQEELTDE